MTAASAAAAAAAAAAVATAAVAADTTRGGEKSEQRQSLPRQVRPPWSQRLAARTARLASVRPDRSWSAQYDLSLPKTGARANGARACRARACRARACRARACRAVPAVRLRRPRAPSYALGRPPTRCRGKGVAHAQCYELRRRLIAWRGLKLPAELTRPRPPPPLQVPRLVRPPLRPRRPLPPRLRLLLPSWPPSQPSPRRPPARPFSVS